MFFCLCRYSYLVHRKTKSKVTWRCTVRNKEATICSAMVNQKGTLFTRMGQDHTHEAVTGKAIRVKAVVAVKACPRLTHTNRPTLSPRSFCLVCFYQETK